MIKQEDIKAAIDTFCLLIERLSKVQPLLTPHQVQQLDYHQLISANAAGSRVLMELCGFNTEINESLLEEGGRGVFVSKGMIRKGQLAALYPGNASLCIPQ